MAYSWGKLTVEQKKLYNLIRKQNSILKKALRPLAPALVKRVRANCPVVSGALKKSIGHKEIAKNGKSAAIIVGPRRNYIRTDGESGAVQRPAKYARVVERRTHFLSKAFTANDLTAVRKAIADAIEGLTR